MDLSNTNLPSAERFAIELRKAETLINEQLLPMLKKVLIEYLVLNQGVSPPWAQEIEALLREQGAMPPVLSCEKEKPLTVLSTVNEEGEITPLEGPEAEKHHNNETCAKCGVAITPENNSGWRVFVEGGTQATCNDCESSNA